MMTEQIEFREVVTIDPITSKKSDAIAVIRNGRQVAQLPEAARLRRALDAPTHEVEDIVGHFSIIMRREPTGDEREFWRAVLDFKRSQSQV
jgi:hypothetical protein